VHDPYLPPLATADLFDPEYRGPVRDVVRRLRNDPTVWDEAHRIFWAAVDRDDPRTVRYVERLYDAGIRHMDTTMLAPLLDHLAALGLERDTLVVLTSDHGEAFLEHGIFLHDDLHRETLRVPLVLRFPGRLPAGTRVRRPARLVDLMPTILELLGVPAPAALQGRSLAPLARGEAATDPPPEIVSEYSSTPSGRVYESLRQGGATYIVDGGAESLFEDPAEHQDRAAARPDAVAAARAALERWRAENRALAARLGPPGETIVPQDESVRRLRALGYVQ
jgi:arylsulfatase A-like enzyme